MSNVGDLFEKAVIYTAKNKAFSLGDSCQIPDEGGKLDLAYYVIVFIFSLSSILRNLLK